MLETSPSDAAKVTLFCAHVPWQPDWLPLFQADAAEPKSPPLGQCVGYAKIICLLEKNFAYRESDELSPDFFAEGFQSLCSRVRLFGVVVRFSSIFTIR